MPEELMFKTYIAETKAVKGKRVLHVTITTDTVDRDGDIVEPKGIKLSNYRKNNVVLLAHDYRGLPIAKGENLKRNEHGIDADVEFPDEGVYPLADTVYQMGNGGFIKAWSIGFIPIKTEDITDEDEKGKDSENVRRQGKRIKSCELLEFSACAVGCNPDALTNMVSKGINVEPLKEAGFIEIEEEDDAEWYAGDDPANPKPIHLAKNETKDFDTPITSGTTIEEDDDEPLNIKEVTDELVEDNGKPEEEFFPEEEDEEKSGSYSLNEIYEIVKENKELKEKIKELEFKAGAVLNAKNKSNLKQAQALIQSVLDSAGTTEEDSVIVIDDNKDDEGDDDVIDIVTDTVDSPVIDEETNEAIEEEKFKAKIEEIINQSVTDNRKYFDDKLDYAMGRVPKK